VHVQEAAGVRCVESEQVKHAPVELLQVAHLAKQALIIIIDFSIIHLIMI
jgi:hypothetical protein